MARWSAVSAGGRFGRKNIILVFVGIFVIIVLYTSWNSAEPIESVRLERYMNSVSSDKAKVWDARSSFDWSSIKFKFPPGDPIPLPTGRIALPHIQHNFRAEPIDASKKREAKRQKVRKLFQKNWQSYRKHAWMKDALLPVSGGFKNQFSGWAATLVDSLDTLWIMGLKEEFDEAVDAVASIDFGRSSSPRVNMFETNIRYLGGLLAAYDLSQRSVLLEKAVQLGDMLYAAFNTENRMPVDFFDFERTKTGEGLEVEWNVVSASPGTISLEFTRLSQVTGDPKYYTAISKITDLFHAHQNETKLPGMWPTMVSMRTEDVVSGAAFTLGSYADSLYEYLPKMHALLGGREPKYETMSTYFMDTANKSLFFRPMLPKGNDILLVGNLNVDGYERKILDPECEHLSCFVGGLYALGGRLLGRDDYVEIGSKLALGCAFAYSAMPTGMMPERYNMVMCASRETCSWDNQRWIEERDKQPEYQENLPLGFTTAKDSRYILRPEAIESVFILYRVTGRQEFQDKAWSMFEAVATGTETKYASAAVMDVTRANYPLPQEDYMESFWLAETLKYFYLVLSSPDLISLDEYVLNTEAHPFKRPK